MVHASAKLPPAVSASALLNRNFKREGASRMPIIALTANT